MIGDLLNTGIRFFHDLSFVIDVIGDIVVLLTAAAFVIISAAMLWTHRRGRVVVITMGTCLLVLLVLWVSGNGVS